MSKKLKEEEGKKISEISEIKKLIREVNLKNKKNLERLTLVAENQAEKLRQAESVIESLVRIQGMYLVNKPKEEVFDQLLAILLEESGSEYGFIGEVLHDEKSQPYLKTFAITNISWSPETKKFYEENAPQGLEFRNLETLFGVTLKTGQKIIANDAKKHPKAGGIPEGHPPLKAYLGVPLFINNKMIGMFGVSNRKGGYSEELVLLLEPLINSVAQLVFAQRKDCYTCVNGKKKNS
ncbi:GAF domain-containing protein [bacterium]|nr:GAF domain-containing protein [bacterium]